LDTWVETLRVKPMGNWSTVEGAGRISSLTRLAAYWVVAGARPAILAASHACGVMVISARPAATAL